eukprot:361039-Chlamydomonas_euryale.AAC.2
MERAEAAPPHDVVDWLSPLFDSADALEQQLLASPLPPLPAAAEEEAALLAALFRMQRWRHAFWEVVHGPMSGPLPVSLLDTDTLVWVWTRLDKALRALVSASAGSLADAGAAAGAPAAAAVGGVAAAAELAAAEQRALHVCAGVSESLGLASAPDKPLAWRHAGRPALPRSAALLWAGLRLRRLAAALACGPAGPASPGTAPADLGAAGVPWQASIERCAGRLAALPAAGPGTEGAARDALAASVACALRSDVALKRSVVQVWARVQPVALDVLLARPPCMLVINLGPAIRIPPRCPKPTPSSPCQPCRPNPNPRPNPTPPSTCRPLVQI